MILTAQLKRSPIPTAQSQSPLSAERAINPGCIASSSSQSATISVPQDLVQQKLAGGKSSVQSDAQPASKSPAESAASPAFESNQTHEVDGGHEGPGSHVADVQNSPGADVQNKGIQGRTGAAGSSPEEPLQTDYLFHFGDTTDIRKALQMPNRLTG